MLYVAVAVGLAALIGVHELVVWIARRTIRRPWAVLLGPIVGYLLLVGCAFALYSTYGMGSGQRLYVVQDVLPGYDALGKVVSGDHILEVDRTPVAPGGLTFASQVEAAGGKAVVLTIERNGERLEVTAQPKQTEVEGRTLWLLGIKHGVTEIRVSDTNAALNAAFAFPVRSTRDLVDQIRSMIEGDDKIDVGGPTAIVAALADAERPAGQRALGVVLRLGFFVWLALFIFDLMRLWRLSRPPDARSSQSPGR